MSTQRPAFIRATPNPIPPLPQPDSGSTTVEWSTGDGSDGWVYLRTPGANETCVGHAPEGSLPIADILRDYPYRFSLYADERRTRKLAAVTVSMGASTREFLLDLGALALAAASVVLVPLALAGWAVRRAWRGRKAPTTSRGIDSLSSRVDDATRR